MDSSRLTPWNWVSRTLCFISLVAAGFILPAVPSLGLDSAWQMALGRFFADGRPREFDAILERIKAAGISYRSTAHGPVDFQVDTQHGGSIVYWNEPDGHQWEMLTVSYARQAQ